MKILIKAIAILCIVFTSMLSAKEAVHVYSKKINDKYLFYAKNAHIIAVYVKIHFPQLHNLNSTVAFPYKIAIAANTKQQFLFSLTPIQPKAGHSYKIRYKYSLGDPNTARHDEKHLYLFPFAHGTKQLVSQGYNGQFTHKGIHKYSLDFGLKENTPIYAARAGTVIDLKQDSAVGGVSSQYDNQANYIVISHRDGSFGHYAHLRQNGVAVSLKEQVVAGQLIGYSGNTGRSSGPHLHFNVSIPTQDGVMESIPIKFLHHNGMAVSPIEDSFYYAFHPGGETFPVLLGSKLSEEDFQNHRVTVSASNKISFRSEKVDHTFVKYLSNGCNSAVTVTASLVQLSGAVALTHFPRKITVPARTEVFLGLFRKRQGARQVIIRPEISWKLPALKQANSKPSCPPSLKR